MNATFAQANTAIYNILAGITGANKPLEASFDNPNFDIDKGYPVAFPVVKDAVESVFDTKDNAKAMGFVVRVLKRDENTPENYHELLALIDAVTAELRKKDNCTLGGIVEKFYINGEVEIFRTSVGQTELVGFDVNVVAESLMSTYL